MRRRNPRYTQDESHHYRQEETGGEDSLLVNHKDDIEVQGSQQLPQEPTPEQLLKELQDELKRAQAERNTLTKQAVAKQRSVLVKQQILQARRQLSLIQEEVEALRANPRVYAYDQNPNLQPPQGEAPPNPPIHMQNPPNQHLYPNRSAFIPVGFHQKIIDHSSPLSEGLQASPWPHN